MNATKIGSTLLAAAALGTAATVAHAAGSTTLAQPQDVQVQAAYAYFTSFPPSYKPQLSIVFRTKGQLPRRYDGLIRASGRISGGSGGSIGSVHGRASRCYTFYVPTKDGRLYPRGDAKVGRRVKVGSRLTVVVAARTADGVLHQSTRKLTVKRKAKGDEIGRPAGC